MYFIIIAGASTVKSTPSPTCVRWVNLTQAHDVAGEQVAAELVAHLERTFNVDGVTLP